MEIVVSERVGVRDDVTITSVEAGTVSSATLQPDGSYDFSGTGFQPGSDITIGLEYEFIALATTTADDNGDFAVTVTIPPAVELPDGFAGEHTLVAAGINSQGIPHAVRSAVVVAAPIEVDLGTGNPAAATTNDAGPISFTADVTYADTSLTDHIPDFSDFTIRLEPVGPGSIVEADDCSPDAGPVGSSSSVTCEFPVDAMAVNTYSVVAEHDGGDVYGRDEGVFTMADPSLGSTTGGGWFVWPETDDRATVGFMIQYNRKGTNVKGSFLLTRRLDDGTTYRLRSNALDGLAVGTRDTPSWASFSGRATYLAPGMAGPGGNHSFVAYVVDDPTGDRFWIEVRDKDGRLIDEMSLPEPADDTAVTIGVGNVIVPREPARGGGRTYR